MIGRDGGAIDHRPVAGDLVAGGVDGGAGRGDLGIGVALDGQFRVEIGLGGECLLIELFGLPGQVDHLLDRVARGGRCGGRVGARRAASVEGRREESSGQSCAGGVPIRTVAGFALVSLTPLPPLMCCHSLPCPALL